MVNRESKAAPLELERLGEHGNSNSAKNRQPGASRALVTGAKVRPYPEAKNKPNNRDTPKNKKN
jgi:hypothetical protein